MYKHKTATFYITDDNVGFETSLQSFYLRPKEPYYYKRLNSIKFLIRIGEIKDINSLCRYTNGKVGIYPKSRKWSEL